jgi:hypothetical protein
METAKMEARLRSMKWYIAALTVFAIVGWVLAARFLKDSTLYSLQAGTYAHFAAGLRAQAEYNQGRVYQLVAVKDREAREGFQTNNGAVFKECTVSSEVDAAFVEKFNARMLELKPGN